LAKGGVCCTYTLTTQQQSQGALTPRHRAQPQQHGLSAASDGGSAGAKPYFERALGILKKRLPFDHPYLQTVASNLARLEQQMSNEETGQP
jgi:hypothetical protein